MALVGCLLAAFGCGRSERGTLAGPRLAVRWTGADTAAFAAPATASRCDTLHLVEIRAISGDTGVGLALYDSGAVRAGMYPIRAPETADSVPPAAAVALRWFSKTAVQGFQADSGELSLRQTGAGVISGTFTAKAHAINGSGKLQLTGSFDELRIGKAARGCAPRPTDSTTASRDSSAASRDSLAVVD